ncbi:MAG TPA: hypothetical protein VHY09_11320 [Candidatus Methylacidiphilales bacterium]|jgi:hypothetical protein|nr:hypothetical protein [Candidatus Methylacidiphilales bacterium]
MNTPYLDQAPQSARREQWFQAIRDHIHEVMNPDGTPKIVTFSNSYREPLWGAAALYTGTQAHIDMINQCIAHWHDAADSSNPHQLGGRHSSEYDIFRSTTMIHLLHRFHDKVTPEAKKAMLVHVEHGTRTFYGSGQPDTKFHGANDNMPMEATFGLIFSGEIFDNKGAIEQGWWNLNQFRLLLSRGAWASEFNSSTYSAVTLGICAQIATYAANPEIRALARDIEHRLWAEVLLHYHPPTFMQAGPQSRAYAIDAVGHTHALQMLLWIAFGGEKSGRDPFRSYFKPDGREVIHFHGAPFQSVVEFSHIVDGDLQVPADLAPLIEKRSYPARLRGRSESMGTYEGRAASYHTQTYMEEEFSLGSVDVPMGPGGQTCSLHATYKLKPTTSDFRDGATIFFNYLVNDRKYGTMEKSDCGQYESEKFTGQDGWLYTLQKDNVGLITALPGLNKAPIETDLLAFDVVFPCHYGKIKRTIIGNGPARDGAVGESADVVPVSIEAGEVFVHIQPLLPTNLPRTAALRFVEHNGRYEVLRLINYEGPKREFNREQLKFIANGAVMTVDAKKKYASLEEFHRQKSDARIVDYLLFNLRFIEFQNKDAWLLLTSTPSNPGAQTEAVDGRHVHQPVFESNQIDVTKLPFVTGPVVPNFPMFRWGDSMEVKNYPTMSWIIGSRGLPGEPPYSHRVEKMKV